MKRSLRNTLAYRALDSADRARDDTEGIGGIGAAGSMTMKSAIDTSNPGGRGNASA